VAGYDGYKMSINAVNAYENEKMPSLNGAKRQSWMPLQKRDMRLTI
jgi:hypothetical protein